MADAVDALARAVRQLDGADRLAAPAPGATPASPLSPNCTGPAASRTAPGTP
ncbi:hypothetical protein [Streptomyces clavuligerus]|uniref:hypothetical protein n=1 Tax=Streptomyces clavuligerus TaxID=1901 RepID=UPI0002F039C3|nr:hypothetical protein [Streptomyces clavuligerus]MBY6302455.1 hypothetical protein [Streptomyces clavuligerus]QPJ95290.1 hypothetical protein GE265_21135 [Streptomyces clavuligerus]QPL62649.1 hypothetical protein I3J04_07135 [Streptomyces clavuligerus]QPL68679.1 hypothetical protein I3J05_07150 [Streptomyces clavuligerus]QPL74760.1 hypothetical protein I3J06_07150 [Streptomyces clavuligerus]